MSEFQARPPSGPFQINRRQVSVRTDGEQYPTPQMSSSSVVSTELQERHKAHEVSLNVDVENGSEK